MDKFFRENGFITSLVNSIPGIENKSYLELGLGRGINFGLIKCSRKVSVDICPEVNPTLAMSTDDFFRQNGEKFDIVFIDADHSFTQVVKDFVKVLDVCTETIFLHDMIPPSAELSLPWKSGNAFKLLYLLVHVENVQVFSLNTDCGLSFIRLPVDVNRAALLKNVEHPLPMKFEEFDAWRREKHRTYDLTEMKSLLEEQK